MDDTQHTNRTSDAAAATRKRRSSILKHQRPPRTPFSDLEFNVATPTDSVKSRRVSFSKRTGVAEFVTNEATTTWKNFYEEHNKSMESSGNESEMHPPRAVVSLGKRIFDQQFEEVEAIDLITMNNHSDLNINNSMQNANFASLEITGERLTAPQNKFELSTFTDHQSKLFSDDVALSNMGEVTECININFSNVQPLSGQDDLDEIGKDLKRAQNNLRPFNRIDMSGYIEVDLNMTNVVIKDEQSDMSITDTVHSPNVQDISKSTSIDKKGLCQNWVADKENIAINPYVAPKEIANFAVNEESDKVLVFDGKRLTLQSEKEDLKTNFRQKLLPNAPIEQNQRKTIVLNTNDDLPNFFDNSPASRYETNSRIDAFVEASHRRVQNDPNTSISQGLIDTKMRTVLYDNDNDISMTQALSSNIVIPDKIEEVDKQRTILYGNDTGNISITQAIPVAMNNFENSGKRRTIVFENNDNNISITEAVQSNVLLDIVKNKTVVSDFNMSMTQVISSKITGGKSEKRKTILYENNGDIAMNNFENSDKKRTIVFENNDNNISITEAVQSNLLLDIEKNKTVVSDVNMSITQVLPSKITDGKSEKRKTILYENNGDISITMAVPGNILPQHLINDKRQTIVFENDGDISITQAIASNIISQEKPNKRKLISYDNDNGDISMTRALPSNIIMKPFTLVQEEKVNSENNFNQIINQTHLCELSSTNNEHINNHTNKNLNILQESSKSEENKTLVYENDVFDISVTQSLPKNILKSDILERSNCVHSENKRKRATIVCANDEANISITKALPSIVIYNENGSEIRNTNFNDDDCDISIKLEVPANIAAACTHIEKRRTILYGNDGDISLTMALPNNVILPEDKSNVASVKEEHSNRHRTVLYENGTGNISTTQAIPTNIIVGDEINFDENMERNNIKREVFPELNVSSINKSANNQVRRLSLNDTYQKTILVNNTKTTIYDNDLDISMTDHNPAVVDKSKNKRKSVNFDISVKDTTETSICCVKESQVVQVNLTGIKDDQTATEQETENNVDKNTTLNNSLMIHKELLTDETIGDSRKGMSKPIPINLATIQNESIKSNVSKLESGLLEDRHQNVLVYQSFTTIPSKTHLRRTEQGDVKCDRIVNQNDDKPASSTTDIEKETLKANVIKHSEIELVVTPVNIKELPFSGVIEKISTATFSKGVVDVEMVDEDKPDSILDDLLDMSTASFEGGLDDKNCTAKIESQKESADMVKKPDTNTTSNESMFYITRDSDEEAQTDIPKTVMTPLSLECKEDQPVIVADLQNKLAKLKTVLDDEKSSPPPSPPHIPPQNRHFEKVVSSNMSVDNEKFQETLSIATKSYKTANDTNDLLRMLSDFTDNKASDYIEEVEEAVEPVVIKGHIALENKEAEPKRLSFAPNRQSMVISREDLLSNISMAQTALQKSISELDVSDSMVDDESKADSPHQSFHKKSVRVSNEVVKTLYFEDETGSETSIRSDLKMSPLKKTAFGETSYMKDRANVIPSYLKDVSDNIKALMSDLVKPMTDLPFDGTGLDKGIRKSNSTCSTQIQANLITSSQIDIDTDLDSEQQSQCNMNNVKTFVGGISDVGNRTRERTLKSALRFSSSVEQKYPSDMEFSSEPESLKEVAIREPIRESTIPGRVLLFDPNNPLNNVSLAPIDFSEVHRYNPQKSTETLCGSEKSDSAQISIHDTGKEYNVERVSTQYIMETTHVIKEGGDTCSEKSADAQSLSSNTSKPMSVDQSIDVKAINLKDIEVNTVIAMKGNEELLEASSSLTLVDDALAHPAFDVNIDTNTNSQVDTSSQNGTKSPVEVIYAIDENGDKKSRMESDFTSNDEDSESVLIKNKKRSYSPTKYDKHRQCTLSSLDITPKPISKMKKISDSPSENESSDIISAKRDNNVDQKPVKESRLIKKSPRRNSPKRSKSKRPGTSVTIHQVLTKYEVQASIDLQDMKSKSTVPNTILKSDEEVRSMDLISSCTSSKNMNECSNHSVVNTVSTISRCSKDSRDWHPQVVDELSSKNLLMECDSSVNVVARIDMLPFMGSQDCEWESCNGDMWAFRLLHGRLRLIVRLAHRHDNATRTRVCADTPVLAVTVQNVHSTDSKNSVAVVCVSLVAESMRSFAARVCSRAGDVPTLLRRCCAVSKVALKWGRAMHDARAQLAYTLNENGLLSLKVANIPLRSVWEVTMRLELVVEDAHEAPWPSATDVRVVNVVSDYDIGEVEVEKALKHIPRDWGHVPRTVWRIFKYLKHKKREDEVLGV